jgi:hypothetical protein
MVDWRRSWEVGTQLGSRRSPWMSREYWCLDVSNALDICTVNDVECEDDLSTGRKIWLKTKIAVSPRYFCHLRQMMRPRTVVIHDWSEKGGLMRVPVEKMPASI